MKFKFITLNRTIASVILILSSLTGYHSYATLNGSSEDENTLIQSLKWGETKYAFTSNSRCVGEFFTNVKHDKGDTHILSEGELRVKVGEHLLSPKFRIEAVFNTIGQLGGGVFRIESGGSSFILGLMNINPISVSLRVVDQGAEKRYETTIPGPILVRRKTSTTFDFEYSNLPTISGLLKGGTSQPFLSRLNLNLTELRESSSSCGSSNSDSLDLTEAVLRLEEMRDRLFGGGKR